MKAVVAPSLPWRPESMRLALRGRVLLRLRPGEAPAAIAQVRDVQVGAAESAPRLDVGRVQGTITRFSPVTRVMRVFHARQNLTTDGRRHQGFDDNEEQIGLSRTFRIDVDPRTNLIDLVQALRDVDRVEMVSPYYLAQTPFAVVRPLAAARPGQSSGPDAFAQVGAANARAMQAADPTVVVAVIDSGLALAHPEFLGHTRPGYDAVDLPSDQLTRSVRLLGDGTGRDRQPNDELPGHGTACAGLIGARGLHVEPGLAVGAPILPVRALAGARFIGQAEPTAVGGLADIDVAIKWAVDAGARVLNLSFGTPQTALRDDDPVPHVEAIRYALSRGCILVAAAGNDGDDTLYFPAALPGVIAIGSVDAANAPSTFSSRGGHVALCAPGEDTRCVALRGYERNTGTSFAAPLVAAAAALLLARAARASTPLGASAVRQLLSRSAAAFARGSDPRGCGSGVLDVPAALRRLDDELGSHGRAELQQIGDFA